MRNYPRIYTSFMPNAPVLNGTPGSLLDIIKKCKIGGWTPFDVTKIEVLNGIATFYFSYTNCSIPAYSILTFTGCDEPLLNSTFTITRGGTNIAQFNTTVADGTYLGTIKAVPEAAGWELMFTGTNQAVIRSGNPDSSRTVVQITDTTATTCQFEFGSDATSITNIIDNTTMMANNGKFILKSRYANATNWNSWYIVCDNTTVYISTDNYSNGANVIPAQNLMNSVMSYYGDFISTEENNETPFGFYFQGINAGETNNNLNSYQVTASGNWYNFSSSNYFNMRSGCRQTQFRSNAWTHAVFRAQISSVNSGGRWSGSSSMYSPFNINYIDTYYKDVPVHCTSLINGNQVYIAGKLPGIKFAEPHLFNIFSNFNISTGIDGDIYLYCPIRSANTFDLSTNSTASGLVPFIMNKKWGT